MRNARNVGRKRDLIVLTPLWEGQKSEGRKGKEKLGKGKRDEVGQLGCILASKKTKWVRMEDSAHVDDEGRPILERWI